MYRDIYCFFSIAIDIKYAASLKILYETQSQLLQRVNKQKDHRLSALKRLGYLRNPRSLKEGTET